MTSWLMKPLERRPGPMTWTIFPWLVSGSLRSQGQRQSLRANTCFFASLQPPHERTEATEHHDEVETASSTASLIAPSETE